MYVAVVATVARGMSERRALHCWGLHLGQLWEPRAGYVPATSQNKHAIMCVKPAGTTVRYCLSCRAGALPAAVVFATLASTPCCYSRPHSSPSVQQLRQDRHT